MLYKFLLMVHIFSAILGMGPGFVMMHVLKKAKTMSELRHAYQIRNQLHIFVMIGGTLLIVTGLLMGWIHPYLFRTGWYMLSLTLFLIALGFGPVILSPRSKPIKKFLHEYAAGEEIPDLYYSMADRLFLAERVENAIFLVVIALMILKPF
ncbi:DUF2269 family protein [Virgibacillus halophilus]|uniref:DUF2269 family protein n=1 Tax=Tigheibacillus halophilus TaxID=361280 RepID=A0ABU5C7J2_9BACI|nr:DUF2269 family protein [Virgibacillus halophilus]